MRKTFTATVAACFLALATLIPVRAVPQQPPPPNAPDQGPPANDRPRRGGNLENRMDMMSRQLNLTDEQRERIFPLMKNEVDRIKEVRSNTNLTQNQVRRRTQAIRKNTRQKIDEILTPEQRKQWQEIRESHHAGPGGGPDHPEGNPDTPPAPPSAPPQN